MAAWSILPLVLALAGQAPEAADTPAARLERMTKSLANYDIHPASARTPRLKLSAEPLLRFTNPVGNSRDGAIFLWLDERDRPDVAVQVFLTRNGPWPLVHELSSLATQPLVADTPSGTVWNPTRAGAELKPVPGAPKPAATPAQRLLQTRELTRDFAVEDDFRNRSWQSLRLLAKPLARYGKPGSDVLDGALFTYVLTTDPEVLLVLEARTGTDGPEWQFAFAPMTIYPVRASHKGREVWSRLHRPSGGITSDQPFYVRGFELGE